VFEILNSAFIRPSRDDHPKNLAEQTLAEQKRRKKALKMRRKGTTFKAIALEVGVHPRTVQHWCAQAGKIGEKAVIRGGRRGATVGDGRVLSPEQEREIVGLITTQLPGPQFRLWCVDAVLALIRERFKVEMSRRSIANYLSRWGIDQKIPRVSWQPEEVIRYIQSRAMKEKALMFWAGQVSAPSCSDSFGNPSTGDIQMLYAVTGRGEIYFMFETEALRESGLSWARFLDELGVIASQRKAPRRAFVLLPRFMEEHEQLMAWDVWNALHTLQRPIVFYVLPGVG
jgi:transposase